MELIVTHSNTDFDGLAAQLAAQKLYPRALAVLQYRLRDNVAAFEAQYHAELPFISEDDLPYDTVERLIVVDSPTVPMLRGLDDARIPTLIIDHHPREHAPAAHEELLHADVGAVTSLLVERLRAARIALSAIEATLLLLGIYEDTGNLTYPSTRPADLNAAAWLLDQGAHLAAVSEFLRRPLNPEQAHIFHQLQANLQIEQIDDRTLLLADATTTGDVPQLAALAEELHEVYKTSVVALAITNDHNGTQIILRASADALDAGAVARGFGGGGHAAAAAAYVRDQRGRELLPALAAAIRRELQPPLTAAVLMARTVPTARPTTTIAQAAALLYPFDAALLVITTADRTIRGAITRGELTAALRHGFGESAVERFMHAAPAQVEPSAPLAVIRKQARTAEALVLGGVLVASANNRLLGVLNAATVAAASLARQPYQQIQAALAQLAPVRPLLDRVTKLAEERGDSLYLVGGTVRDLLLKRQQIDLDLVVEGDAIALAQAFADATGGTLLSHAAFGTATVTLDHAAIGNVDFVTARVESYPAAAALPEVTPASVRHDLLRRDFTINALAIGLNPAIYGRLYDYTGGQDDLSRGVIRVLHSFSFIDDPTRILRALRLAARLGFIVEPHTQALLTDALARGLLRHTSAQRVASELRLIAHELQPEAVLALLDATGVLRAIHPALGWAATQTVQLAAARAATFADAPFEQLVLGLALAPLTSAVRCELLAHFAPSGPVVRLVRDLELGQQQLPELHGAALANSALDRLLHGVSAVALRTLQLTAGEPAAARIALYLATLRPATTALNGDDLRALGVVPGPRLGTLLGELRAAKLDGLLATRAAEEAWVRAALIRC